MNWIRQRISSGQHLFGAWLCLGSESVTEIVGQAGFDWVLIDQEHGITTQVALLHQLQALSNTPTSPIVRVPNQDPSGIKSALDLGAAGIMVPWVNSPEEARRIVSATRYSPAGIRGLSGSVRATRFGGSAKEYIASANEQVTTMIQIETAQAVEQVDQIAAVDGVDVLFVGPADLSLSLGIPSQLNHPDFQAACRKIVDACRKHHKQAGILLKVPEQVEQAIRDGFTVLSVGLDIGFLMQGMERMTALAAKHRSRS